MNWLEITVETEAAAVETVSGLLHEYGEGGVAVYQDVVPDDEDAAYHYDTTRPTLVTTYVPATPDGERRRAAIAAALGHLTAFNLARIGPLQAREVAEEDWANAWKDFYHPMRFGRRLVIKPSWRDFTAGAHDLVIELDPGMAFGTGLHQTTAMCLALLEEYVQPGAVVLDQGTGSGILALAAARLGAARVVAVDTSEVAVAAAQENAARNGLGAVVAVQQGAMVPGQQGGGEPSPSAPSQAEGVPYYHLIVANIIANVIIELAPRFAAALGPRVSPHKRASGTLIASGIIREREEDVRAALQGAGLAVERREARDEWIALVARR